MSELIPAPFSSLVHRAFKEMERERKIFDLPESRFFRADAGLDLSVTYHGRRASTPAGPAAGPHGQMAQNIVLSWLAGARIIELKTIQIQDRLKIPRPCIDTANVGFNVEWSQELRLEESLREYVAASMLIEMIQSSPHFGIGSQPHEREFLIDMSVGYDLEGIRSYRVRHWLETMKNAESVIRELRPLIPDEWRSLRELPFRTCISDTVTLSTFHGCPAGEIERIVEFLLSEMDVHVTVKMNPTLLGHEMVDHLLHDRLGYHEIQAVPEAFEKDLQFEEALDICRRMDLLARRRGKRLGVKFSNTLVVRNHKSYFSDPVMYLSGAPLHVLTMNLVRDFRSRMGDGFHISFSAGIDQINFPTAVGLDLVPVTMCTDLLRPGGYGRLPKYLMNLEARMRSLGVRCIGDYILKLEGQGEAAVHEGLQPAFRTAAKLGGELSHAVHVYLEALRSNLLSCLASPLSDLRNVCSAQVSSFRTGPGAQLPDAIRLRLESILESAYGRMVRRAGLLNTHPIVERTTADVRYGADRNSGVPRRIGSHLLLYDCINCDKCVPVCPNDANFVYEAEPVDFEVPVYEVGPDWARETGRESFRIREPHQLANFADFCNDCGNCDTFCPEEGGPYVEKPRFFGNKEAWQRDSKRNGFAFGSGSEEKVLWGRIEGRESRLVPDSQLPGWIFTQEEINFTFIGDRLEPHSVCEVGPVPEIRRISLRHYWILRAVYRGILAPGRMNYINVTRVS